MKIDALVFSKNRAAQLDLLLRSIRSHAPRFYDSVTVLWKASTPFYESGYRVAIAESAGLKITPASCGLTFWREYDFHANTQWWLHTITGDAVSFLVDDDVFYRRPDPVGMLPWSLRGGDYDYPFSLDGNVYRVEEIRHLLDGLRYNDPTMLEALGHEHRRRLPFEAVGHGSPCVVGVPANRVSISSGMPHLGHHEYDLNERFLQGERIALPKVDCDLPAHAGLDYVWWPAKTAAA